MNLEIVSYNGIDLNNELFKAYFPRPSVMTGPEVDIGEIERSYFSPISTYKKRKSKYLFIHIKMMGEIASDIDTLNALFNPYDPDKHELVVRDINDNNKQYYVMGTPAGHPDWDGEELVVSVKVDDPIWKTKNEIETSWAVTATGDQETVSVGGSFYSEPTFEITPTAAKSGGKAYRIFCPVYNPSTTITYTDYQLDIVNNALDTAALIASTSQSNQINQVGGIGTDLTPFPIDTPVGDGLPASGMGYVDSEQFSFTISGATLTPTARGLHGTTPATHADNAVIYVSKMNADGSDIRVTVDGVQVNFWLQDINNATSQVWNNGNLSPGYAMTNGVLIAGSGAIATITLENTTANIDAINALPSSGCLMIDSELFIYTSKNVTTRQFTGIAREAHNTSAAEHTVGDYVRWIEREIYIYHGEHDLPAFTVDDDYKPIFELSSTNASWVYHNFLETYASGIAKPRGGAWIGFPAYTGSYSYYESMSTTLPSLQTSSISKTWSVLGHQSRTAGGGTYFDLNQQAGITNVEANGKKYLATGSSWFNTGYPSFLKNISAIIWTEAAPSVDTETAWSQNVSLSGTYYNIRSFGYHNPVAAGRCEIETDTVVVTLDTNNVPVVTVGSSVEYYHVNASLVNTTTGHYIDIDHYLNLNTALVINTSDHTVIDNESGAYKRGAIQLSTYRHDWLKMIPGPNLLQWDEAGATGLTIAVKRRERKL